MDEFDVHKINRDWLETVVGEVKLGDPDLNRAEQWLLGKIVRRFVSQYIKVTGKPPEDTFANEYLVYCRIEHFGFKMPRVDQWEREDIRALEHYHKELELFKREGCRVIGLAD